MRKRAYTLIEMLTVIVILAMTAALVVPNLASSVKAQRKRAFLSGIDRLVSEARQTAIREGRTVVLAIGSSGNIELQRQEQESDQSSSVLQSLSPPDGISIAKCELAGSIVGETDWLVSFYSDGKCDDGALELLEGNGRWQIRLNPETGTGRIRGGMLEEPQIQRWEAGQLVQRT